MTATINIHQAKTHFSKLIERVRLGEEIVIAKAGQPVARLVPERRRRQRPSPMVHPVLPARPCSSLSPLSARQLTDQR